MTPSAGHTQTKKTPVLIGLNFMYCPELKTVEQAKLLANTFVNSQFGHAPDVNKYKLDAEKNTIHQKTLCMVSNVQNSTYEELLTTHSNFFILQKLQKHLVIEVF